MLRSAATDHELSNRLRAIWTGGADRYSESGTSHMAPTQKIEMSYLGGE